MWKVSLFLILHSVLWAFSLEEVLIEVEKQNLEIQQSLIEEEVATLRHQEAKQTRFGSIDLSTGYTQYNSPRTLAPMAPPVEPNTPKDKQIVSANISYRLVLFDGFGTKHTIAVEELSSKMANLKTNQTKWSLRSNVISLYIAGLALQERLPIQKEYVKVLDKLESITKEEERAGRKAHVDFLQVSTQKTEAYATQIAIQSDVTHIKLELLRLMGTQNETFYFEPIKDVTISNQESSFIKNTSSIQLADLEIKRAQKAYQKTKSSFFPRVTFETLYSRNYGDSTHENTYQAGVGIEWRIFDFGVRDKRLERARLEKLKAMYGKEDAYKKLRTAISQSKLKIAKSKEEYALKVKKSILSNHVEKIEFQKLEEGMITMQSYLLHATDAHFAEIEKHNAFYSLIDAKYQYLTLLEIEK